ncbi:uncharacterized protein LOC103716941 isoform X2 [Phoenix dactylifera]|uniref:Uncharacterized protein LOC103716941 isoform X2 n=1 Tax=Phoenix dactylifera TaxID=42345 RepID=A0A8B7CP78_PHODC|nr:uncharacterized protein LOC103716941 isoform X2 [Phoenix dactylifera]
MIKREALRLFSCQFQTLWSIRGSMALTKHPFSATFCGFSQLSESYEQGRFRSRAWVDMRISFRKISSNTLRLRSCMGRHDDVFRRVDDERGKAHAVAPYCESLRNSEVVFGEEVGAKLVNGNGACIHGNPLGFSDHSLPEKLVVAVDVDEVLGSFLSALNQFIADRYSSNHSVTEYYVYEFFKIWNCSRAEADIRVHEFFKTVYFKEGIHPIPGAQHVLHKLATFCNLSVVTSRQHAIKEDTLKWIEKHYPGLFQEIHFGNHFALDGQSRPKSEICKSLGAQVLIDDNPRYALECADVGIRVLLFDYENSYPWCKTNSATSHPLVTKVHNWQEVENQLVSLAVP